MKIVKKAKPFSKKYRPVVVYFEALQEIFDTMKATCEKVELSSENYKFDSLEDAKAYFGSRPQFDFAFSSSSPYAQVEFSRMNASVYVSAGDKSAQLYHDLDNLMIQQQRKFAVFYGPWIGILLFLVGSSTSVLAKYLPNDMAIPLLCFLLLFFAWYLWIVFVGMRQYSIVRFERRNEARTFVDQNRNAILLAIITSLVSGATGYGFAKLKDGLPPTVPVSGPSETQK